jgi:hypothetical protein
MSKHWSRGFYASAHASRLRSPGTAAATIAVDNRLQQPPRQLSYGFAGARELIGASSEAGAAYAACNTQSIAADRYES